MLKKHMAACLVTTALLAAPALAQTSSGSGSGASAATSGKFLSEEKPNQWRASKLVGINVYGPNREKVGDVNEVLIDRNGKAEAVVIGVGGFLGIGEKDVALPFDQVHWSDNANDLRSTSASGTGTGAGGAGTTASGGSASGTAATGAGTTTGSTGTAAGRTDSTATRGYPDHGMITMTKDELKNAPSFRYAGSTSRDNSNASGARSGGTATGGASGMGGATGAGTAAPAAPAGGTAPRQ